MIYSSAIVLLGIAVLILIINLPLHVTIRFGLAIAAMYGISKLLGKQMKINDDFGMLMVRSKAGLMTIEKLARNEVAWKLFADLGTVMAYGLLSFFFLKRPLKERAPIMLAGLVLLSALVFVAAPYVFPFLVTVLGADSLAAKTSVSSDSALLMVGFLYLGGLALMTLASLLSYSSVIASAAISTIFFGTGALGNTAPGATLIIPGINIPFAEGIIALAVILAVHEGAHAVLSRVARVRILSSGIVLFGILPIGAFVEPDEEALKKLDTEKQTRVLVAGSAANLFTALIAFFIFLGFLFATAPYKETGLLIASGNHSGSVIYTINGQPAMQFLNSTDASAKYNTTLTLGTDRGAYETTIQKGELKYYDLSTLFFLAKYPNAALQFMYNLIGLIFSLNFVIGMVNLLPLPFFDGYRLLEINVDKKIVVTALSAITALAFLVNFLPWLF